MNLDKRDLRIGEQQYHYHQQQEHLSFGGLVKAIFFSSLRLFMVKLRCVEVVGGVVTTIFFSRTTKSSLKVL